MIEVVTGTSGPEHSPGDTDAMDQSGEQRIYQCNMQYNKILLKYSFDVKN
jgi:hypothetical protein